MPILFCYCLLRLVATCAVGHARGRLSLRRGGVIFIISGMRSRQSILCVLRTLLPHAKIKVESPPYPAQRRAGVPLPRHGILMLPLPHGVRNGTLVTFFLQIEK